MTKNSDKITKKVKKLSDKRIKKFIGID